MSRTEASGYRESLLLIALAALFSVALFPAICLAQPAPPVPAAATPPVAAQPEARSDHRCAAASALEGLEDIDRTSVAELCQSAQATPDELSKFLNALAGSPRWQTTLYLSLVAKLLPPAPSIASLVPSSSDKSLKKLVEQKGCSLRGALETDAANRTQHNAVGAPVTLDALKSCGIAADGKQRVLTIAGANDDQVSLAVFGAGKPQALRMADSHEVAGIRYFVAVLPAAARVRVLHQAASADEPAQVYDVTMATDQVNRPQEPGRRYCVEVQVKASSETMVLLDAQLLGRAQGSRGNDEHSYWVRAQVEFADHQLNVLRKDGGELARLPIRKSELSPSQCATYRLDLTERRDVAFTIAVDDACTQAGVVPARARMFMKALLEKFHGPVVKDLEAWAEVFRTVHGLQQNIGVFGVQASGVARGSLDSFESLKLAAGELTREGFNEAFVSKLSCSSDAGQWSSTFTVYALKVAELRKEAKRAEHSDLTNAIIPQYETVTSLDDLRDLIAAPIARLHGKGYVRWVTDGAELRLYGAPRATVDLQGPKGAGAAVQTRLYELGGAESRSYCSTLRRKRRLVLLEPLSEPRGSASAPSTSTELQTLDIDAQSPPTEQLVELPGLKHSGTYVLEATLTSPRPEAGRPAAATEVSSTFACVDVTDSRDHVWGLFDGAFWGFGSRKSLDSISALAAISFAKTGHYGLWATIGASASFLSAASPPSWDDVGTFRRYDVNGNAELTWQKHSLLLGAGMQYDVVYWRGGALILRWAALLDIGEIVTDGMPQGLSTFLEKRAPGDNIIDIDLSAVVHAGFRFQLGERFQANVLGGFWARGFDDALFDDGTSIRRDGGFAFSAAVGLGYDL